MTTHVVVSATVPIRPGTATAFAAAATDMTRAARADPGCSAYVMMPDPLDPSVVCIFEVWRDVPSFLAYAQSSYAGEYARRTADLRTGPTQVTLLTGTVRHSGPAPGITDLGAVLGVTEERSL